jgi:glycosyltransferase involved in cell wall biosynthesis
MPSVVHVIVTANFAGAERYVSNVASETAMRGWDVAVVGGDPDHMPVALSNDVHWLPGATALESLRSLARLRRRDVCHAHMTLAEAVALVGRPFHRAPVVSTRHFAAYRGSSPLGRFLAPWIARRLARQLAVSRFVSGRLEQPPDAIVPHGVPRTPLLWNAGSRVVLVLQRLEREKDTLTALRAWAASGLAAHGWSLRVLGGGSEQEALKEWVASQRVPAVTFGGWTADVAAELVTTGILLAPSASDSFGLAVVEAMAAGVPVVACGGGGHLETTGLLENAPMFPPGDVDAAARALRSLLVDERRTRLSRESRKLVASQFGIERAVDRLLHEYEIAALATRSAATSGERPELLEP